jgi:hypothetical protein
VPVQILQDGVALTNQLLETFVAGSDPSLTNAPPPNSAVQIYSQTTNSPVVIPSYSVVRLEWTVFAVAKPVLTLTSASSVHTLHWTGLTNVTYAVQSSMNLASWTTLGTVSCTQTNCSFNDPNTGTLRFYRVAVP